MFAAFLLILLLVLLFWVCLEIQQLVNVHTLQFYILV